MAVIPIRETEQGAGGSPQARAPRTPATPAAGAYVIDVRLTPQVPDSPTWNKDDRATATRVIALQLAELAGMYGAGLVCEALALALRADLAPAAEQIHAPELARRYVDAATCLQLLAPALTAGEDGRQ